MNEPVKKYRTFEEWKQDHPVQPIVRGHNALKQMRKVAKHEARHIKRTAKVMMGRKLTPEELRNLGTYVQQQTLKGT